MGEHDDPPSPDSGIRDEWLYTCLRASCGWSGPFWLARVDRRTRHTLVICPECLAICISRAALETDDEGAQ